MRLTSVLQVDSPFPTSPAAGADPSEVMWPSISATSFQRWTYCAVTCLRFVHFANYLQKSKNMSKDNINLREQEGKTSLLNFRTWKQFHELSRLLAVCRYGCCLVSLRCPMQKKVPHYARRRAGTRLSQTRCAPPWKGRRSGAHRRSSGAELRADTREETGSGVNSPAHTDCWNYIHTRSFGWVTLYTV